MSPPTLSDLPIELKCQIMEACDSLSTVIALAQTASLFQQGWRSHTKWICQRVLPRSLECHDCCQTLAEMQSSAENLRGNQEVCIQSSVSVRRFQHMIANSHAAVDVCNLFSKTLNKEGPTFSPYQVKRPVKPCLTSTERARLTHSYYMVRIFLAGLNIDKWNTYGLDWANDFTASMSPRGLWRVRELMNWFEMLNSHGLNYVHIDSTTNPGFAKFRRAFQKNFRNRNPYAPGTIHNDGISSFFDECQHYLESLPDTII